MKGKRLPNHLSFPPRVRVVVIMRDGSRFEAKFKARTADSRRLTFFDHEPVRAVDVRALTAPRRTADG